MADIIQGLSIGLNLDSTGLDRGLKSAKQSVKMMSSEMASNMSAFDRSERSVNKYQTQIGGLTNKLNAQKQVTSAARAEYDRMVATHGEGSTQANRAAAAYNNEVAAVNNLERHVESLTEEMRQFQAEQDAANSSFGRMSTALTSAGANMTKLGSGMKNAGKSMSMYVTAPIVGFGAAAAKVGIDFDDSMAKVQAISGATGGDLDALREKAKEMGATTKFSASDAAEGLNFMALNSARAVVEKSAA